jgi:hypothetical protein
MNTQGMTTIKYGLVGLALSLSAVAVQAAPVTYTNISATDLDEMAGFNVAGTVDGGLGSLSIDVSNSLINGFDVKSDTLVVTVNAAPGEILKTITYSETGGYSAETGFVAATIQLLVNGAGPTPGTFMTGNNSSLSFGNLSKTVDVSALNLTSAVVSISNQLFATPTASIWKDSAQLSADTQVVPLPPAMWLMGAAMAALVSVGRRQSA